MSRRILVPGEAAARGGLIIPGRPQEPDPLVGTCSTCDRRFYRGEEEEWQRHVYRCAMENLPAVLEAREEQKKRMAVFQPDAWNPDVDEHLRKVGERMIREGRMEMRKNERVENE